jgi:hypothetical protein
LLAKAQDLSIVQTHALSFKTLHFFRERSFDLVPVSAGADDRALPFLMGSVRNLIVVRADSLEELRGEESHDFLLAFLCLFSVS